MAAGTFVLLTSVPECIAADCLRSPANTVPASIDGQGTVRSSNGKVVGRFGSGGDIRLSDNRAVNVG